MSNRALHIAASTVLLMGSWLLWSGHYTVLITSFGVLSVIGVVALCLRLGILDEEAQPFFLFFRFLRYLPWLVWEVFKANWDVVRVILSPSLPIHQRLVRVKASQNTDLGQVLYANSITLTPGTVSLDVRDGAILVHALTDGSYQGLKSGVMDAKVAKVEGR